MKESPALFKINSPCEEKVFVRAQAILAAKESLANCELTEEETRVLRIVAKRARRAKSIHDEVELSPYMVSLMGLEG